MSSLPGKRKLVSTTLDGHFGVQMKERRKTEMDKWLAKGKPKATIDPQKLDSWYVSSPGNTTGTRKSLPANNPAALPLNDHDDDDEVMLVKVQASPLSRKAPPASTSASRKQGSLSDEENIPRLQNRRASSAPCRAVAADPTVAAVAAPTVRSAVAAPTVTVVAVAAATAVVAASPSVIDLTDDHQDDGFEAFPVGEQEALYYSMPEFKEMWKMAEEDGKYSIEEIEQGTLVRDANRKMAADDTQKQAKAQYGRILFDAMQFLLTTVLRLERHEVFLDVGHGAGNTCLQAAYTIGCEARGIEVDYKRNLIATEFAVKLEHIRTMLHGARDGRNMTAGELHLRHGRLEAMEHGEFLANPQGVTKAFANNFEGVFAYHSAKTNQKYFLDHFLAGIFAKMKVGSMLVTLHPLDLGPSQSEANKQRRQHGLAESSNSSFYEDEKLVLGEAKDVVSWSAGGGNSNKIEVWKYTRVKQETSDGASVFMCCNPKCDKATLGTLIPATVPITVEGEERTVINTCDCKFSVKKLRSRGEKVDYV